MAKNKPPFDEPISAETQEVIHGMLKEMLAPLEHREREIIKMRTGIGDGCIYSYEHIGRVFRILPALAQQIEEEAYRKLEEAKPNILAELQSRASEERANLEEALRDADEGEGDDWA